MSKKKSVLLKHGRPTKQKHTVETSLGTMEYKVVDFLRAIKKRPTLYDFLDVANDGLIRQRRHEKWVEIGEELFPPFKKLPESEQLNLIFSQFKRCWKKYRCNMMKCVRAKESGDPKYEPYIFSKEMDFYVKHNSGHTRIHYNEDAVVQHSTCKRKYHAVDDIVKFEIINGSFTEENTNHNNGAPETPHRSERLRQRNSNIHSSTVNEPGGRVKRRKTLQQDTGFDEEEDCRASALDPMFFCQTTANGTMDQYESSQPEENSCDPSTRERFTTASSFVQIPAIKSTVEDEADTAFFESIKPSLRKMDESQKLDFKIEMLQLVKKYQNFT